jgi:hypothetical protein
MTRSFFFFAVLVASPVACGGEVDAVRPPPTDPSDPRLLPSGLYALTVIDASCDVNLEVQGAGRQLVVRHGTLANIPAPTMSLPRLLLARQELDLGKRRHDYVASVFGRGYVDVSWTITELTPTRLALVYREEGKGIHAGPACSIGYALTLAERACPPPEDPSCTDGPRTFQFSPHGRADVTCAC